MTVLFKRYQRLRIMKSTPQKPSIKRPASVPRPTAAKSVKPPIAKSKPVAKTKPAPAAKPASPDLISELLAEFRAHRARVETTPIPSPRTALLLDQSAETIRRMLGDLIEQRMESVIEQLVQLRLDLESASTAGLTRIIQSMDRVLDDLGATRFDAEILDYFDPLIHLVVEERTNPTEPEGTVAATLRPGFKTSRGRVVAKARVAVHRKG
jgi:hypothetical protein